MTIANLEAAAPFGYEIEREPRFAEDETTLIGYWWHVIFHDYGNFTLMHSEFAAVSETSLADAIGQVLAEYRAALAGDRPRRGAEK